MPWKMKVLWEVDGYSWESNTKWNHFCRLLCSSHGPLRTLSWCNGAIAPTRCGCVTSVQVTKFGFAKRSGCAFEKKSFWVGLRFEWPFFIWHEATPAWPHCRCQALADVGPIGVTTTADNKRAQASQRPSARDMKIMKRTMMMMMMMVMMMMMMMMMDDDDDDDESCTSKWLRLDDGDNDAANDSDDIDQWYGGAQYVMAPMRKETPAAYTALLWKWLCLQALGNPTNWGSCSNIYYIYIHL